MARQKARQNIPLSGDRLVDIIFKMLLDTLEKEIKAVRMKKDLRDPTDRRQFLRGLLIEGKIYLGKRAHVRKKSPLISTLIHELAHEALGNIKERRIRQFESILWVRFTDAQKRFLRKYIPKYEVKEEPKQ